VSSDTYYVVRRHPDGGYAAVLGFASDERYPIVVPHHHQSWPTIQAAFDYATQSGSEYGVSIHPELREDWDSLGMTKEQPAVTVTVESLLRDLRLHIEQLQEELQDVRDARDQFQQDCWDLVDAGDDLARQMVNPNIARSHEQDVNRWMGHPARRRNRWWK
jgi:hypothetical protein